MENLHQFIVTEMQIAAEQNRVCSLTKLILAYVFACGCEIQRFKRKWVEANSLTIYLVLTYPPDCQCSSEQLSQG